MAGTVFLQVRRLVETRRLLQVLLLWFYFNNWHAHLL